MDNPFRSEDRGVPVPAVTIGYFALIVIAAWISTGLGFVVFIGLSLAVVGGATVRAARSRTRIRHAVAQLGAEGERRILVVANETVGGEELLEHDQHARARASRRRLLVVSPALNSRLRTLHVRRGPRPRGRAAAARRQPRPPRLGGNRRARRGRRRRSAAAIEDALRTFGADEIVISTHPEGRSNWLERGVVESARASASTCRSRTCGRPRRATTLALATCRRRTRRTPRPPGSAPRSSVPLKAGIAPPPFVTCFCTTSSRVGFTLVEVRPDVAASCPASVSVWHEPQFAVKIDFPSVGFSAVTPVPATAPT